MQNDELVIVAAGLFALVILGHYAARWARERWSARASIAVAVGICGAIGAVVGAMLVS